MLPAAVLAAVSLAGCGAGGGSGASAAATTGAAGGTTGAAPAGTAAPGTAANGFAAYAACLSKNGVTLPTGRPGGFARPSGSARPTGRPTGGSGGGAFGLDTSDPKTAAAVKACASVRPTGGFGGGGTNAALQSQLTAYSSCLSDHGVTLPTPAAGASATPGAAGRPAGFGGLGSLNTADPKTAAAVKACQALRPTFTRGSAAPTPTPSPSS